MWAVKIYSTCWLPLIIVHVYPITQLEVSRLMGKLEWYAENQVQLDKDSELMKAKDKEISTLKETIASLEQTHVLKGGFRVKARGAEARRVAQLESQVRELEKVIQKRFPNSLSALILASNSGVDTGSTHTIRWVSVCVCVCVCV